eukprot:sb/3463753/
MGTDDIPPTAQQTAPKSEKAQLRRISRTLVQQAAAETAHEHPSEHNTEENWNPDEVYQRALTKVEGEIQDQLLNSFLHSNTSENETVDVHKFIEYLRLRGLSPLIDPRFRDFIKAVSSKPDGRYSYSNIKQNIPTSEFKSIVLNNPHVLAAIKGDFVVEDFQSLVSNVDAIFEECKAERGGNVTTYIPSLALYSPDTWAMAICTVDGQMHDCGCSDDMVTMQSVTKPLFYGVCLDELGEDVVHSLVGKEPSGHGFNKISLGRNNIPHNPLINTGAISLASLYKAGQPMSSRFSAAMSKYQEMVKGFTGGIHFNNAVYLSELGKGHRNYAIGYYLKSKGCLGEDVDLKETMELYFQMCSVETSIKTAAVMAGTLANGGRNVFTGDQVLTEKTVLQVLAIMFSCGMYDYSGEWAFNVGLPAKSGVSGLITIVIPDRMGIALWSPPLDSYGNSVRGVQFAQKFVQRFSEGHNQNVLHPFSNKRHSPNQSLPWSWTRNYSTVQHGSRQQGVRNCLKHQGSSVLLRNALRAVRFLPK